MAELTLQRMVADADNLKMIVECLIAGNPKIRLVNDEIFVQYGPNEKAPAGRELAVVLNTTDIRQLILTKMQTQLRYQVTDIKTELTKQFEGAKGV